MSNQTKERLGATLAGMVGVALWLLYRVTIGPFFMPQ
jgi:hypothetical protein